MSVYNFIFPVLGYLAGSLPFALWVTRYVKGVDIRDRGSGHVTTTNTIRQAGWQWGVLVLLLDIAKGFLPTLFAVRMGLSPWGVALTATLAVVGHCWPVWAQFRGGMGLATTGGSLLAVSPLGFVIALGVLISLTLIIRHSARAALFTGLLIPVALWALGQRGDILWVAAGAGWIIAVRFLDDWNREYRELWLDREKG